MGKAAQYLALTYLLTWSLVGAFALTRTPWTSPAGFAVGVAAMFMPALAAVIVQRRHGEPLRALVPFSRPNRWFLVAWLLPAALALLAAGLGLLMPGVAFSPGLEGFFQQLASRVPPEQLEQARAQLAALPVHPFWLILGQGMVAGATVNVIAAFGEELGWRGLLWQEWRAWGFWKASAAVGAVWGLWHAPMILLGHNYPQHPVAGVFMMTLFAMLATPWHAYVRERGGSVLPAAIMHGTLNATAAAATIVLTGGSDLLVGVSGLAGMLALVGLNAVLALALRPRVA